MHIGLFKEIYVLGACPGTLKYNKTKYISNGSVYVAIAYENYTLTAWARNRLATHFKW